ncbi:uncharacterized protein [Epargyreus clarus]|uniref:uncharacterized protein n=1 Tax=Epargyreus clarus TaxID=520877 RepID=UPI003C2FA44F
MYFGIAAWLVVGVASCTAERWAWPEGAASVRIDTKVRFVDLPGDTHNQDNSRNKNVQSDEVPFREPTDTAGFYNRPPGQGRYPVHVHLANKNAQYRRPGFYPSGTGHHSNIESDGTLDSLQYCKCVSRPDCNPVPDKHHACGTHEYLCCYNPPNIQSNSEFFNEVDDERPALLPGHTNIEGPFPPPPDGVNKRPNDGRRQTQVEVLVGPEGPTGQIGIPNKQVLVGPDGPTGIIGPGRNPQVLVGPDGPTGIIGPGQNQQVLVGSEGPTGIIGPGNVNRNPGVLVGPGGPSDIRQSASAQRGVLVGPGGPTGIIGPQYNQYNRPVLVGPGGPTGIIGPRQPGFYGSQRRGVLSGPGGPTGIIGPAGFNQRQNPGVLVGPGGPTGIIGPGRSILVGPGGPTGQIGPRNPLFGK